MRKPISATVGVTDFRQVLVAVCDDGSVWEFDYENKNWRECDPIPGTLADAKENSYEVLP